MKMKIKREILVVFLAVMFIPLTCAGGFAEMDVGLITRWAAISPWAEDGSPINPDT